jgi:hypothetical protein
LAWGVWIGFDWLRIGTSGRLCVDEPSGSCATEESEYRVDMFNMIAANCP